MSGSAPTDLDIAIPVCNERTALEASVRMLHAYLSRGFPFSWQITIVDAASTDGTLRVARRLEQRHGISVRVVDLRWLAPLPVEDILREAHATGRVLVVDETRRSGGVSEGVVTALVDDGFTGAIRRVTSEDSFIPLGEAAYHVLVDEETVEQAAWRLLKE